MVNRSCVCINDFFIGVVVIGNGRGIILSIVFAKIVCGLIGTVFTNAINIAFVCTVFEMTVPTSFAGRVGIHPMSTPLGCPWEHHGYCWAIFSAIVAAGTTASTTRNATRWDV